MIDFEKKILFVHIPKTGGTSIESAFRTDNREGDVPFKHLNVQQYLQRFPVADFFKFALVRNPWDITVSMYKYMWESNYDWPQRWRSRISASLLDMTFRDWVRHPTFQYPSLRSFDLLQEKRVSEPDQFAWISQHGRIVVDHVCKFENLQADLAFLCDRFGFARQSLPHLNQTVRDSNFLSYYDEETFDIVKEKYARDIEVFRYGDTVDRFRLARESHRGTQAVTRI